MTLFNRFYLKHRRGRNDEAYSGNPLGRGAPLRSSALRFAKRLLGLLAFALGAIVLIQWQVYRNRDSIHTPTNAPSAPVAIVFGAAGAIVMDRVRTGVDLYKSGKVRKLLMTGDNDRVSYNEPRGMRDEALRLGVPSGDIVCDYAGFRTYDSLYRARDIFGVTHALLVTQSYHLPRALYIGRGLGMNVQGVESDRRRYALQTLYDGREVMSTVRAWIDVNVTHPKPRYLGKREPIEGA